MVDEYVDCVINDPRPYPRSDSSMVDEYKTLEECRRRRDKVQIPLWSMNTPSACPTANIHPQVQIPLWSMNTPIPQENKLNKLRSDSSMVDEYGAVADCGSGAGVFRFLYGR